MATQEALVTLVENDSVVKTSAVDTRFGRVLVHVQGELEEHKAVFLTVHDIGANHSSMRDFVDNDSMLEIRNRSVFLHLDVLGQEDGAQDYSEDFPSIQQIRPERQLTNR